MIQRERPSDGGMTWHDPLNAFECLGCGEFEEIRRRGDRDPDRLAEIRELLVIDHTECWKFNDPEMARQARRFRKKKTLRKNMEQASGQGSAIVGPGLAAQRVAWRGALAAERKELDREAAAIRERWRK